MTEVALTHTAFAQAMAGVDTAAEHLRRDRNGIDERVSGVLGRGWAGVAAESYVEAWGDWKEAAGDVLEGLLAMRALLESAHADFVAQDEGSQQALDQLSARLIDRLGG